MSTIQNFSKSLVSDWKPVCSLVGDAISGAEFAPFPSPLPPASGGGWAGPQPASSSLVFTQSFVLGKGRRVVPKFRAFPRFILIVLLSHSLSSHEEIPHVQGKRNPSKKVGIVRGHQRTDTLKP